MKRKLFFFALLIALISSMGAYVLASQSESVSEERNVPENKEDILYADSKPLNKNPEPVLKGNIGITPESEYKATVESILDEQVLKERNGEVKLAEYMTYGEYGKLTGDEEQSTEIAKDRVVFVVQVYYPDGFEHVKVGLIKNCLATGFYDAESGEYLGGSFESLDK